MMNNIRPNGLVTEFLHEKPGYNLKKYFKHFNDALNDNKSSKNHIDRCVMALIDYLDEYVAESFTHEEAAMNYCEYDDMVAHMEEHTRFIFAFSMLKKNLCRGGNLDSIYEGLRSLIDRWMKAHVNKEDMVVYNHVKRDLLGISSGMGKSNSRPISKIKVA